MEKKVTFKNSKGDNLVGILNKSENTNWVVVFVHGFNSTKNHKHFLPIVDHLFENGISSFRFDAYGQGESDGKLEDLTISEIVDDTLHAIKYVINEGFKDIGLVGTSLGGFASIITAGKYKDLKFLALKSPVSDYFAQVESLVSPEEIISWKEKGFVNYGDADQFVRLNYSFYEDLQNHDAYKSAKKLAFPVMIVHGDADNVVSVEQSKKLSHILPHSKFEVIKGADHGYKEIHQAEKMRKCIIDFVLGQVRTRKDFD